MLQVLRYMLEFLLFSSLDLCTETSLASHISSQHYSAVNSMQTISQCQLTGMRCKCTPTATDVIDGFDCKFLLIVHNTLKHAI